MSFTSVSLHLGTGWYNIGPALVDATKGYPGGQKVPEEDINGCDEDSKEDWAVVLDSWHG